MTFITIAGTVYPTCTAEQVQTARTALTEAGQVEAPVFTGEPDGDCHRNGGSLFAYAPVGCELSPARQATFAARRQAEAELLASVTPEETAQEELEDAERRAQQDAWQ